MFFMLDQKKIFCSKVMNAFLSKKKKSIACFFWRPLSGPPMGTGTARTSLVLISQG